MHVLLRLSKVIDACNERIGRAAAWLGLAAVIVSAVSASLRYGMNIGSNAWLEMQWYLNSAVFMLVAAWALKRNDHVRIDVISGKLSPRAQAWIAADAAAGSTNHRLVQLAELGELLRDRRILFRSRRADPLAGTAADPGRLHNAGATRRIRSHQARRVS